jgi:hypothetical protein
MRHVLADEAGDEVVAVVVTGVAAQVQWMAGRHAGGFQQVRPQLASEKFIRQTLIDAQRQALAGSGSVRCSGANRYGQLGDGTLGCVNRPTVTQRIDPNQLLRDGFEAAP